MNREVFKKYYKTRDWKRIRAIQLRRKPFCEHHFNEKPRKIVLASVCDHIDPSWFDWKSFLRGPFQSLCRQCHDLKTSQDNLVKIKKKKTKITYMEV